MTTEVVAINKGTGHTLPGATRHDAGASNPPPAPTVEAVRAFIEEAFRRAGKPVPTVFDGPAYMRAGYLAAGKPIPGWLADDADAARAESARLYAIAAGSRTNFACPGRRLRPGSRPRTGAAAREF